LPKESVEPTVPAVVPETSFDPQDTEATDAPVPPTQETEMQEPQTDKSEVKPESSPKTPPVKETPPPPQKETPKLTANDIAGTWNSSSKLTFWLKADGANRITGEYQRRGDTAKGQLRGEITDNVLLMNFFTSGGNGSMEWTLTSSGKSASVRWKNDSTARGSWDGGYEVTCDR
jgi:hypothetical protein